MGTTGRKVVGILNIIHGVTWLIFPLLIGFFVGSIASMIPGNVPGLSDTTGMLLGGSLIIIAIPALIGIFWIILGVGLFMDQEWAAKLTMIFAILTLIGSFFFCHSHFDRVLFHVQLYRFHLFDYHHIPGEGRKKESKQSS